MTSFPRHTGLGVWRRAGLLATLAIVSMAAPVTAQTVVWDYGDLEVSRVDLEELFSRYESVVNSSVYGERLRAQASASAEQIRARLDEGDFGVGDRIVLKIEGEEARSDTAVVEPGRTIVLKGMGQINLKGVLRSELQQHLSREIARFIRDPVIQTQSLMRLSIQGSVGRPGFYVVPATALLGEVIMSAGGPAPNADLDKVKVERNGEVLIEGQAVQEAFSSGMSLDQLNLRAGDQLTVPLRPVGNVWLTIGRYALMIGAPLLLGVRLF